MGGIPGFQGERRVGEDKIEGSGCCTSEVGGDVLQADRASQSGAGEVAPDDLGSLAMAVDKIALSGAAAQRLNPDGPASGKKI